MRFLLTILVCANCIGASYYVDSTASGSQDGSSWANAWTNVTQCTGLSAGDTVWISGGSAGSTNTYYLTAYWNPAAGSSGNPITYKISPDIGYNGHVEFEMSGTGINFLGAFNHVTISGDAGDGNRHMSLKSGDHAIYGNGANGGNTIEYFDFGTREKFFYWNTGAGVTMNNCRAYKWQSSAKDNIIFTYNTTETAYDSIVFTNCFFYAPRTATTGYGDDLAKDMGTGVSFYNCYFEGYTTNYVYGQHQDGIQWLRGNYGKVIGNTFRNIGNYAVFCEAYHGGFTNVVVANNLAYIDYSELQGTTAPQGFVIAEGAGYISGKGTNSFFRDVVLANNNVIDYGAHKAFSLTPAGTGSTADCVFWNNVAANSSGTWTIHSTVSTNYNVMLDTTAAASAFTTYSEFGTNDYTPDSADTVLLDQGGNLSSYFTDDITGATRSGTWDIGAYEFGAGGGDPPAEVVPTAVVGTLRAL